MNLRRHTVKAIQKIGWIYVSDLFFVTPSDRLADVQTNKQCELLAITSENAVRSCEFREEDLTAEFRAKLEKGEAGFFAVVEGQAAGNIWATVNRSPKPATVRGFMRLMPKEALIHDIVTGTNFRGLGIGPYMVTQIVPILFGHESVQRIVIDVNVKNTPSLKMMRKAGLRAKEKAVAVSLFQNLIYRKTLENYV